MNKNWSPLLPVHILVLRYNNVVPCVILDSAAKVCLYGAVEPCVQMDTLARPLKEGRCEV